VFSDLGGQIYAMDADKGSILWQSNAVNPLVGALSLITPEDDRPSAWLRYEVTDCGQEAPALTDARLEFE
jgi:hypothetical protein